MNYWNVYMGKHRMQMNVCIVLFGASAQKKHFFPEKRLKLLTSAVSQFNMGCEVSESRAIFRHRQTRLVFQGPHR